MKKIEEHRDRLLNLIKEINSLASPSLVIVEGDSDKRAIYPLVYGKIEILSYTKLKKRIFDINLYKEYLILTDFDDEGEKLHKAVKQMLREKGIKENRIRDDIRHRIRILLTIYGYSIYDSVSYLKRSVDIDLKKFRLYVMSKYSHLLYDDG